MKDLFLEVVKLSITGSIFVAAVALLRLVFRKAPRWVFCLLWALAAARLALPVQVETELSLIPPAISEGQAVEGVMSGFVGDTSVYYEGSGDYEAAIDAGLEPVFAPGGHYVVTQTGSLEAPVTVGDVLAWVWLGGIALMVGYTFVSWAMLRRRVRTAVRAEGNIWECESVDSPFVLGLFRPRIYLHFGLENPDRAYVIAHEKAHLRRGDHWWKPLGFLILSVYWFNPVIWVAYVLLCRDIEGACDEKVIGSMTKDQIRAYSRALLNCSVHRRRIAACPVAFGEAGVKARIQNVMHYKKPAFWIVLTAVAASVVAAVLLLTDPAEELPEETVELTQPAETQNNAPTDPFLGTMEDQNGSCWRLDNGLFGVPCVIQEQLDYREKPDDPGNGVFTYRFFYHNDGTKPGKAGDIETDLLTLECITCDFMDYDGDGAWELLVQVDDTRNPYRLYDLEGGQILYSEGETAVFPKPGGAWPGPDNRRLYTYEDYFAFERFFMDTEELMPFLWTETGTYTPKQENGKLYLVSMSTSKLTAVGCGNYEDLRILGTDGQNWIYCVEENRELFRIDPTGRRQDLHTDAAGKLCAGASKDTFAHFQLEDRDNLVFFTAGAGDGYGIYRLHLPSGKLDLLATASEPISMSYASSNYRIDYYVGAYKGWEEVIHSTESKVWDLSSPNIALFQDLLNPTEDAEMKGYNNWYNAATFLYFEKPEELDLSILFRNGFLDITGTLTERELTVLGERADSNRIYSRLPRNRVEAVLKMLTGRSVNDLETNMLDKVEWVLYDEKNDTWYMPCSIAPSDQSVYIHRQEIIVHKVDVLEDETFRVWYLPMTEYAFGSAMDWEERVMVLKKNGNDWHILSNTLAVTPRG